MYKLISLACLCLMLTACANRAPANIAHFAADNSLSATINQYRIEQGLPPIPVSAALSKVARAHVLDLEQHHFSGECNLHSWSNQGDWSACCYTDDHARAQCMWDKPREISGGLFTGNGFEIAAQYSGVMTTTGALAQWQDSPGHHNVILNKDVWKDLKWQSIGAAVSAHHAVVWFSPESDATQ